MLVANHVSWLDIFAINAIVPARFVAKSEVRRWPFVGWLCARAGTLFIERTRRHDTARINDAVGAALRRATCSRCFRKARRPTARRCSSSTRRCSSPRSRRAPRFSRSRCATSAATERSAPKCAYDGDKSVWRRLMGMTSQREILAHVCFLEPIVAGRPPPPRPRARSARRYSSDTVPAKRTTVALSETPVFEPQCSELAAPHAAGVDRERDRPSRRARARPSARRRSACPRSRAPARRTTACSPAARRPAPSL